MCKKCNQETVFTMINGRNLCRGCFIKYFEKKIIFTIRKHELFEKYEPLYIEKGKYSEILRNFLKKIPVFKLAKKSNKSTIILSDSADDAATRIILNQLKKDSVKEILPRFRKNYIFARPLYLLLDKEIELYSKLKGIKIIKISKEKDSLKIRIKTFIDYLETKHPEVKYSTVNAFLQILPALKSN